MADPFIVGQTVIGQHDGDSFIAMELLEGPTLHAAIGHPLESSSLFSLTPPRIRHRSNLMELELQMERSSNSDSFLCQDVARAENLG